MDDNIISLPNNGLIRMKPDIVTNEIEKDIYVLRRQTIGNEAKLLTTDGSIPFGTHLLPGYYNTIKMPNQSAWNFNAKINAYSANSSVAGFSLRGIARNDDIDIAVIIPSVITESWKETALENCSIELGTNGSQLEFTVTGVSGETIDWSGVLEICQAQYLDPSSGGGTGGGGI
jgi:hypothetical protein